MSEEETITLPSDEKQQDRIHDVIHEILQEITRIRERLDRLEEVS